MKHISLCSGIGGFDLPAEWMGWENVAHCEINPFCRTVLKHYWPNATSYGNIKETDFRRHAGTIDVLSGGFPCQPYSTAGKRLGKDDPRHLWPEMFRAVREIAPRWVVGENVRGLVNWNGGLVFDEVQADLETAGYEVLPFLLPACAVNAPHRRDRIWFISRIISNANDTGLQSRACRRESEISGKAESCERGESCGAITTNSVWQNFPTQSPVCRRNDGIPARLDGITVSKHRNESIKAYGNAIVPQVVYQIFKAIEAYESINHHHPLRTDDSLTSKEEENG